MHPLLTSIAQAAGLGYSAQQVLDFLTGRFSKLKKPVKEAKKLGHAAEDILEYLSTKPDFKGKNEFEQTQKGLGFTEPGERLKKGVEFAKKAAPLAIGLGAAGVGVRSLFQKGLPALGNVLGKRGQPNPGPQAPVGTQQPQTPDHTQTPSIFGPTTSPKGKPIDIEAGPFEKQAAPPAGQATPQTPGPLTPQVTEEPQIPELRDIQKKEADTGQLWFLAQNGKTQGNPFLKASSKLIKDGTIRDIGTFKNFKNWWNATEEQPRSSPLVEFEKFRTQTKGMFEAPTESVDTSKEFVGGDKVSLPNGKQGTIKDVAKKVATVVKEDGKSGQYRVQDIKKLSEAKPQSKEYAKPLYKQSNESEEEWQNRKTIATAAKKAAQDIVKGKSFLDLGPVPKEALGMGGISVAEDVLNFMAGNTNAYEYLDEDDRQEIEEARDLYGAQITPNMVWNMLLVHEPKLKNKEIRPKSVKGRETIKGGKMGSSEFRRSLTHMVYGMLSGKGISTELSDKITKLSKARAILDTFDSAFKAGKRAKMDEEMEKLMDDDYFNSLFTEEVEELARKYR